MKTIVTLLVLPAIVLAQSDPLAEPAGQIPAVAPALVETATPVVDHLVPVEPTVDKYSIALRQALMQSPYYGCIRMMYRPAFEPQLAVSVHREELQSEEAGPFAPSQEGSNFVVTLTALSTNIYETFRFPPQGKEQSPFSISTNTALLDLTTGAKCFRAWELMLNRTRFPKELWLGCDGYTAEFQYHTRFGKIWNPPPGPCLDLVEIGQTLVRLAQADEPLRPKMVKDLNTKLDKFIETMKGTEQSPGPIRK